MVRKRSRVMLAKGLNFCAIFYISSKMYRKIIGEFNEAREDTAALELDYLEVEQPGGDGDEYEYDNDDM